MTVALIEAVDFYATDLGQEHLRALEFAFFLFSNLWWP
jgi:hypothetical protein